MVISLERDSQNDNAEVRNTTLVRVLKNRFSGDTGPASYLQYDRNTGRQFEEIIICFDNDDAGCKAANE